MKLRWITWWPAPYWIDRFNHLAAQSGIDLEVCFLSAGSSLQEWNIEKERWQFNYRVIKNQSRTSGYFRPQWEVPNPMPLISGNFDLTIMPYADVSCLAAAAMLSCVQRPYILFVANTIWDDRNTNTVKEMLKKIIFRRAAAIFATGPAQQKYAMQYGVDTNKTYEIGNPSVAYSDPVEQDMKDELKRVHGFGGEIVILYVGRLSEEKGLLTLLDAVANVKGKMNSSLRIVLAGAGHQASVLQKFSEARGLQVTFTGFLQKDELATYYLMADIFVLPSQSEPWGLVVNEAMHFALPVIVSDRVGAVPSLLEDEKNGLVFQSGNVDHLARCLEKLVIDSDLRVRMGGAARQGISSHSIERWGASVLDGCSDVLARKNK